MRRIAWTTHESTWFVLAICWAAISIVAWLLAITRGDSRGDLSESGVVLAAISIAAVSIALRWPIIAATYQPRRRQKLSVVWWLNWLALINWLGFLALSTNSFMDFGLTFVLLIAMEAGVCFRMAQLGRHPWPQLNTWYSNLAKFLLTSPIRSETQVLAIDNSNVDNESDVEESDLEHTDLLSRKTIEGIDPDGRRYLSGWVIFNLAYQQKNESLSIAFCPAIIGESDIELECQPEAVSAKSSVVTPSGMRIELRRSVAAEPLAGKLYWQATELPNQSNGSQDFPRSATLP